MANPLERASGETTDVTDTVTDSVATISPVGMLAASTVWFDEGTDSSVEGYIEEVQSVPRINPDISLAYWVHYDGQNLSIFLL
jgi:hypothetical protein